LYEALLERMGSQSALVRKLFEDAIRERLRARSAEPEGTAIKSTALVDDELFFSRLRSRLGGRLRLVVSASAALEPEVAELLDGLKVPVVEWAGPQPSSELTVRATASGPAKEHRKDAQDESKSAP
jgi:long-chain acyl-CoA synthetase